MKVVMLGVAALTIGNLQGLGQAWIVPSAAELSMTSLAEVPGASAMYLNREEIADDFKHGFVIYARVKVLSEAGKDYANVEIPYATGSGGTSIDSVSGRTIHPDGSIVAFSGKPYDKLVTKSQGFQVKAKVFTLPAVEVGSIFEYRYNLRYDDNYVRSPDWYVQSDLFTRDAHFQWTPTSDQVVSSVDGQRVTSTIAWTPILPAGVAVKESRPQSMGNQGPVSRLRLELAVHNVPPIPREEYMPPTASVSYRVLFYYTSFRNSGDYWKSAGKHWSGEHDKFVGPGRGVTEAAKSLVGPGDTPDQKLHKLYDFVMTMDNSDFTREHSNREDKATGFREVKTTDDVLARKRGSSDQLSDLFVALARAAGFKAYTMGVADRQRRLFLSSYLSTSQLDDDIAIVNVDGKDRYFDPGSRYCAYGHLSWRHASTSGLRQVDGGTAVAQVPGESYRSSRVTRIADLTLDESGVASGTVKFTFTGDPALRWRQAGLRGDETSLHRELQEEAERALPGGIEVKVTNVEHLTEYEQPLVVSYTVKGGVGALAGRRLLVPGALFESNSKAVFPQEKRDLAVDMHYAAMKQDAMRMKLPPNLTIEAVPTSSNELLGQQGSYKMTTEQTKGSVTIRRDLLIGEVLFLPAEYAELRSFYNKFQVKDQEQVVLIRKVSDASGTQ